MQPGLPIGVFDSGLGGLTIAKALRRVLPNESLIYFGDTAHLPYGDKSPELIQGYCRSIARFLLDKPVKAIVIACNTASAVALRDVQQVAGSVPVFDVIEPAAQEAVNATRNNLIGVIATKTTINSNVYWMTLRQIDRNVRIIQKATPLLVPMIEEGWLDDSVSKEVIEAYLSDTGFVNLDVLILGCTHYPLVKPVIEAYFEKNFEHSVTVIDSSLAVAERVKRVLGARNLLNNTGIPPQHRFFVSDFTQNFEASAQLFLGEPARFEKVSL